MSQYVKMMCAVLCPLASHVWLFVTPWTVAHQAPLFTGILQARVLEWVAMPSCRGSFWHRDWTHGSCVFCITDGFFTTAPLGKPPGLRGQDKSSRLPCPQCEEWQRTERGPLWTIWVGMCTWSKGLLGKAAFIIQFSLQILKSRGVYTAQYQAAKGLFLCVVTENTHTHTHTFRLRRVSLRTSLALWLLFIEGTSHGPLPWYPVIEKVSKGGYLKGDVEGLEMTLQVIQLNEVGCVHRLAIHKGGWRHDSERGKHEICHPNAGSPLS